ncbi:MAG: ATP-binding protein [Planctomycetes bacterium]|nr:ATP-binding protein [Planctomycetota bacterium]
MKIAHHAHKDIVIPNSTRHLVTVRQAVFDVIQESGFPEHEMLRIALAIDEALSNIMEHAFETENLKAELTINLSLDADEEKFEALILDSGKEFDPGEIESPDILTHVASGQKTGLGIFLMRQVMNEVKYTFVSGFRNELRMIKYAHDFKTKGATNAGTQDHYQNH